MSIEPSDSVMRAWARLMRVQHATLSAVESALKAAALPPLAWYDALLEVERVGQQGIRPFELEQQLLLPQYGLSRLLDRMVAAGYLERHACEDDGRGHMVTITEAGKDLRRRMWPVYAAAIDRSIAVHLTENEAATLGELLEKLIARRHG